MKKLLYLVLVLGLLTTALFTGCGDEEDEDEIKNRVEDLSAALEAGDAADFGALWSTGANVATGAVNDSNISNYTAYAPFSDITSSVNGDDATASATGALGHSHDFTLVKEDGTWYFVQWDVDGTLELDKNMIPLL